MSLFTALSIGWFKAAISLLGNDLGRVLRWGAGYSGEDPYSILTSVDEAENVLMDRWTILLDAQEVVDSMENGNSEPEPPKVWTPSFHANLSVPILSSSIRSLSRNSIHCRCPHCSSEGLSHLRFQG